MNGAPKPASGDWEILAWCDGPTGPALRGSDRGAASHKRNRDVRRISDAAHRCDHRAEGVYGGLEPSAPRWTARLNGARWVAATRLDETERNYVRLHLVGGERLMRQSIGTMEETLLDPGQFVRIHRSAIVNLSRITAVEPISRAEYGVILDDGTRVTCSRGYRDQLRERVFFSG